MAKRKDWRSDEGWTLAAYDTEHFKSAPGPKPPPRAELGNPPLWASLYEGHRIVATWYRSHVEV